MLHLLTDYSSLVLFDKTDEGAIITNSGMISYNFNFSIDKLWLLKLDLLWLPNTLTNKEIAVLVGNTVILPKEINKNERTTEVLYRNLLWNNDYRIGLLSLT